MYSVVSEDVKRLEILTLFKVNKGFTYSIWRQISGIFYTWNLMSTLWNNASCRTSQIYCKKRSMLSIFVYGLIVFLSFNLTIAFRVSSVTNSRYVVFMFLFYVFFSSANCSSSMFKSFIFEGALFSKDLLEICTQSRLCFFCQSSYWYSVFIWVRER